MIASERLDLVPPGSDPPRQIIIREQQRTRVSSGPEAKLKLLLPPEPTRLILASSGMFSPHPAMDRLRSALAGIEVHLPFEVLPLWAARAFKRRSEARGSILLEPTTQVSPLASNLANVYHALRNEYGEGHWRDTMDYVRMGLGPEVESVNTRADAGGGAIALTLSVKERAEPMSAAVLSDGQLAYLAFVGLYRLRSRRTLLAMDEPELHLHPGLLTRVVQFLETVLTAILHAKDRGAKLAGKPRPDERDKILQSAAWGSVAIRDEVPVAVPSLRYLVDICSPTGL